MGQILGFSTDLRRRLYNTRTIARRYSASSVRYTRTTQVDTVIQSHAVHIISMQMTSLNARRSFPRHLAISDAVSTWLQQAKH